MKARLYYEAHITVQPFKGADWPSFSLTASTSDFWASRFDVDEVDHYDGAWFLSARDSDFDSMKKRIKDMLCYLEQSSHTVMRWKIEDTLLDSKHGDEL